MALQVLLPKNTGKYIYIIRYYLLQSNFLSAAEGSFQRNSSEILDFAKLKPATDQQYRTSEILTIKIYYKLNQIHIHWEMLNFRSCQSII